MLCSPILLMDEQSTLRAWMHLFSCTFDLNPQRSAAHRPILSAPMSNLCCTPAPGSPAIVGCCTGTLCGCLVSWLLLPHLAAAWQFQLVGQPQKPTPRVIHKDLYSCALPSTAPQQQPCRVVASSSPFCGKRFCHMCIPCSKGALQVLEDAAAVVEVVGLHGVGLGLPIHELAAEAGAAPRRCVARVVEQVLQAPCTPHQHLCTLEF